MIGNIRLIGAKDVFTNGDDVSMDVLVERNKSDPFFSSLIESISARLVCRGQFMQNGQKRLVTYYSSQSEDANINYITQDRISAHVDLQFPNKYLELPSTLRFNDSGLGIEWFIIARVKCLNNEILLLALPCEFIQTMPVHYIPVGYTHTERLEVIDGSKLRFLTTYPSRGFHVNRNNSFQHLNLSEGVSFKLECSTPCKFSIRNLNIQLEEVTTFCALTNGEESSDVPHRFFELTNFIPPHDVPLDSMTTDLSKLIGTVLLDHDTLPHMVPTYVTSELRHYFNIVVDITVVYWDYSKQERVECEKRLVVGQIDVRNEDSSGCSSSVKPSLDDLSMAVNCSDESDEFDSERTSDFDLSSQESLYDENIGSKNEKHDWNTAIKLVDSLAL